MLETLNPRQTEVALMAASAFADAGNNNSGGLFSPKRSSGLNNMLADMKKARDARESLENLSTATNPGTSSEENDKEEQKVVGAFFLKKFKEKKARGEEGASSSSQDKEGQENSEPKTDFRRNLFEQFASARAERSRLENEKAKIREMVRNLDVFSPENRAAEVF